jgi:hypothetical protein
MNQNAQLMSQSSERMMNTILQVIGKTKKREDDENYTEDKPITPYEKEKSFKAKELEV